MEKVEKINCPFKKQKCLYYLNKQQTSLVTISSKFEKNLHMAGSSKNLNFQYLLKAAADMWFVSERQTHSGLVQLCTGTVM